MSQLSTVGLRCLGLVTLPLRSRTSTLSAAPATPRFTLWRYSPKLRQRGIEHVVVTARGGPCTHDGVDALSAAAPQLGEA